MSLSAGTISQAQHVKRIKTLYKRSLKHALDFIIVRTKWYPAAKQIRKEFEKNKFVSNPAEIDHLVQNLEEYLVEYAHPMPYKHPYLPGSTFFSRYYPIYSATQEETEYLIAKEQAKLKDYEQTITQDIYEDTLFNKIMGYESEEEVEETEAKQAQ